MVESIILDYSQVEVAADAVRSACLKGKKMAIKIKEKTNKNISVAIFMESMYILESKKKKMLIAIFLWINQDKSYIL